MYLLSVHPLLFIIIIFVIAYMQGNYNYIPETTHVSRVYSVAAVLYSDTSANEDNSFRNHIR